MYDETIELVAVEKTTDNYGDQIEVKKTKTVFAEVKSITQSEFYQAQAVGMKPEIKFAIADYLDYQGEKHLMYKAFNEEQPQEYSVIRTYRKGNELEIVCKRGVE